MEADGAQEWGWVDQFKGLGSYTPPQLDMAVNGWTWKKLVAASPFPVEEKVWPEINSGYPVREGRIPCTDGATVYVEGPPVRSVVSAAGILFHELAHCLLHYPKMPDPNLIDPLARHVSVWEAEACLTACKVMSKLGLGPSVHYNTTYLDSWRGDWGRIRFNRVAVVASTLISRYRRERRQGRR